MEKSVRLGFPAMNNERKLGMITLKKVGAKVVEVFFDLRLIAGQVKREFKARDQRMYWYIGEIKQLQSSFNAFSIKKVPISKNSHADSLATLATLLRQGLPRVIIVEDLVASNWDNQVPIRVSNIHVTLSWMDQVLFFLKDRTLLKDKSEAKKI